MKLRRVSLIATTIIAMTSNIQARTIRDFFLSEPSVLLELTDKNTRMDLLDYYDNGRIVTTENTLGNDTELISVNDTLLSIQTSKSGSIDMWLNTTPKDTMIIVNATVKAPAADSKLMFFNKDWKQLEAKKFFTPPTINDYIIIPDKSTKKKKDIDDMIDISFISYTLNPKTGDITATQNLEEFLSKEDWAKISPYLKKEIKYSLKGDKYLLQR